MRAKVMNFVASTSDAYPSKMSCASEAMTGRIKRRVVSINAGGRSMLARSIAPNITSICCSDDMLPNALNVDNGSDPVDTSRLRLGDSTAKSGSDRASGSGVGVPQPTRSATLRIERLTRLRAAVADREAFAGSWSVFYSLPCLESDHD
jgi:hypothetical protein